MNMYIHINLSLPIYILYIYMYMCIYPPTYPERRACETPLPSLEHAATSDPEPSKQGPAEDISPASQG